MKKKLISLLLAATMVVSICACGGDTPAAGTETQISESAVTSETITVVESEPTEYVPAYPIVDEEITLRGLVVGRDTSVRSDRIVWNKVSEVTGINIEWEVIDKEALATYLAGGDWPDFFMVSFEDSIVNDYGVSGGKFVNLLDYLEYMPNLVQTFEDYPEARKAATELNGEMYEFVGISSASTTVYVKPFYRTDLFEKAGVTETPTTVEEFHDALAAVKEYTGEAPWIPVLGQNQMFWSLPIYSAFGTSTEMLFDVDENGKVQFMRSSDQMKHYYEYMNQLYDEGLIHKECATMETSTLNELELGGKVAIIERQASALSGSYFDDGEVHLDALAPLTSEYDTTQTYQDRSPVEFRSGPFLNAESEYVVEMCKMFDIMYATEEVVEGSGLYGMAFTYGLEGEHWDFTETSYTFHTPETYGTAHTTFTNTEAIWDLAGRCDAFGVMVTETPGNNQVRQQAYVDNVIPYETDPYIWGYMKFTEDEQYVLDNKFSDINTYYLKMEAQFITGVSDVETEWDAYCAELEKMGIADVLKVYQAAYDRWVSFE